jgi:vesicle coat complex subunit
MCVPKVYELTPKLVEEHKMIEEIQSILEKETNSVVIANAIISLAELSELKGSNLVTIGAHNIEKILAALSECMDWGQVFILDH